VADVCHGDRDTHLACLRRDAVDFILAIEWFRRVEAVVARDHEGLVRGTAFGDAERVGDANIAALVAVTNAARR
jgi:hypothetical protein